MRQSFLMGNGAVRGHLVKLDRVLDSILNAHNYQENVASLLAEALLLGTSMAGALKFDGVFTIQIQSDGQVPLLVADVTNKGDVRGYARFNAEKIQSDTNQQILGEGWLALTIDQGTDMERYQGIVALAQNSIEKSAMLYFSQSEQIATVFKSAVAPPQNQSGWRGAALMIQQIPSKEESDAFNSSVILMNTLQQNELLDASLSTETLLYRLFHTENPALTKFDRLQARCRCSHERVKTTLASFPPEEINELRDEHGKIVITCEFCCHSYVI